MFYLHSSIAFLSSSTVSAAIAVNSNQTTAGVTQHASVQDVVPDQQATETFVASTDSCVGSACTSAATVASEPHAINGLLAEHDGFGLLQPVVALILIVTVLVVFFSRKSVSTK